MNLLAAAMLLLCAPPETGASVLEWMAGLSAEPQTAREDSALTGKIGGRYRFWQGNLEGTFRADDNAIQGTSVDIDETLGLEKEENLGNLSAWFGLSGAGRIFVDWVDGTYEGDMVLANDVTFAGTTFLAGSDVHSKLEWRALTGLYLYDLPMSQDKGFTRLDLSFGAGIKFLRLNGRLTTPGLDESGTFKAPFPVVAGTARLSLGDYLAVEVEANGMHVESWEGVATGTIYDVSLSAQVRYNVFFGGIGYRWFGVNIEDERADIDKVQADFYLRGIFGEVGVTF